MGGLRKCANQQTPHFTNDPFEMFCMHCGLQILAAEPAAESGAYSTVSATVMQGNHCVAVVQFPWGEERFPDRLAIGREASFSPIAGQLASFLTVSGVHAEFRWGADGLVLIHFGRTNPTYVNGKDIGRDIEVPVPDRARVHFSNECECTVRIES